MGIKNFMFFDWIRVCMALNRLAIIGLQNFAMDYLIVALRNQISMHASSLEKVALFWRMLMIATLLGTWWIALKL